MGSLKEVLHIWNKDQNHVCCMHGSRKFCQRESNFDNVFLMRGGRIQNTTISGPSLARQWNTSYMAFRWCADVGPTLNGSFVIFRGSASVLLRNPIFLWFFGGGGGSRTPVPPSGSLCAGPSILYMYNGPRSETFCRSLLCVCIALFDTAYYVQTPLSFSRWKNSHFTYVLVHIYIQCSPSITQLIRTWIWI